MVNKNMIYFSLILLFFFYLFLILNPSFEGPDQPIYYAYTASVVEDGDLNAINHLNEDYPYYLPSGEIGVSITYNLPDFHNHGGVVLWVPFYLYGKLCYFLKEKLGSTFLSRYKLDDFLQLSLSFTTLIFFIFIFILTSLLTKMFFASGLAMWPLIAIFFGTPFFYYTLFEPGNANIVATFFSTLLILFSMEIIKTKRTGWFFYGVFFSICIIVKVDLWFYILFILLLLYFSSEKDKRLIQIKYFVLGFIPAFLLKMINDFLKYGTLHSGELNLFNLKDCYLWEQLFSSYRGFFYTSPIFYLTVLGFILLLYSYFQKGTTREGASFESVLLFLWIMVIFKILMLSKRFAWGGGTCGARPLLTEYPVFVLSYAYVWQKYNRTFLKWLLIFISLICILWNFLVISEYMLGVDIENLGKHLNVLQRMPNIKEVFGYLLSFNKITLKLTLGLPLLLLWGLILYIIKKKTNKLLMSTALHWFTIYLLSIYFVVTLLNVINNKKKVEKLRKEGFFENVEVLTPKEYEKMENVGSMNEMIEYFTKRGNLKRVNKIKKIKKEIYGEE